MKSIIMLAGAGALSLMLCGCAPELDQTQLSPEEQAWAANFKANYSGWQPPESIPRSVRRDDLPAQTAEPAAPAAVETDTLPPVADAPAAEVVDTPAEAAPVEVVAETPAETAAPEVYTVVKGDTLGGIARKFYGKASAWKKIQDANADVLKGKTVIRPGMKLSIPRP